MAPRRLWSALNRFRLGALLRRLGRCSGFDVDPKLALERVDDHSIARLYSPAQPPPGGPPPPPPPPPVPARRAPSATARSRPAAGSSASTGARQTQGHTP